MAVDVATGAVSTNWTDFTVRGKFALVWNRTYRKGSDQPKQSTLGPGWAVPYYAELHQDVDGFAFTQSGGAPIYFDVSDSEKFIRNVADCAELRCTQTGCTVTIWDPAGGQLRVYHFNPPQGSSPQPVQQIENDSGHKLVFDYNSENRLETISQHREQRKISLQYNEAGQVVCLHLHMPDGGVKVLVEYEYNEAGLLVSARDAAHCAVEYVYDSNGRLELERRPNGAEYRYEYNKSGRCVRTYGLNGFAERTFRYLDQQYVTEVTDSKGMVWHYEWLPTGQVTGVTTPLNNYASTMYDDFGRIIQTVDPNGAGSFVTYDECGNVASLTDALGHAIHFEWNDRHQLTKFIDEAGNQWTRQYDTQGNLIATADPLQNVIEYSYNQYGDLITAITPEGTTNLTLDVRGHLLKIELDGLIFRYEHDFEGNIVREIDAYGQETTYNYDPIGQVREIKFSDGTRQLFEFTPFGQIISEQNPLGAVTRYRYGECSQLLERIEPSGRRTSYRWDSEPGRLLEMCNSKGEVYQYQYDQEGKIVAERDFVGNERVFSLDNTGKIVGIQDDRGDTHFSRDMIGRVLSVIYADGNETSYHYDPCGRIVKAQNQSCSVELEYDPLSRIVKESRDGMSIVSDFDVFGRVRRSSSWGDEIIYDYGQGGLRSIAIPGGGRLDFLRDTIGHLTGRSLSNGIKEVFIREDEDNTINTIARKGVTSLTDKIYRFDTLGNLLEVKDSEKGLRRFKYTQCERLAEAEGHNGVKESFLFDSEDNLLERRGAQRTALFKYGHGNQLLESTREQAGDWRQFEYDGSGNLVQAHHNGNSNGRIRYEYNGANRLSAVVGPQGERTEFEYDPFGRRIAKHTNTGSTHYWWDGAVLFGEKHTDKDTNTTGRRDSRSVEYVYSDGHFDPLCKIENGQPFFFHNDHLGTPQEITDHSGNIVWSAEYDVFGHASISRQSTNVNNLRFPGQYFDCETGLHYNFSRYYDPGIGRYLSPDPLTVWGGINLYTYTLNPVSYADPLGLTDGADPWVDRLRANAESVRQQAPTQPNGTENVGAAARHDASGHRSTGANSVAERQQGRTEPEYHRATGPQRADRGRGNRVAEALSIFQNHAEGRAMRRLWSRIRTLRSLTGRITMASTKIPCRYCRIALQAISNRIGLTIRVFYPGSDTPMEFSPGRNPLDC